MTYARYLDAEYKINEKLIRRGLSLERGEAKPKDPNARMNEMRGFLQDCGNPQKGIPAIHVGGTSGKGTVCALITGILSEAGLKVGLHISPYLQSATEKIWVAGRFASSDEFADLVDWVMPVATPRVNPDTPASIHGMASVAIAFEQFRRDKVDVMVYEVGCGGRYDLTSFVDTSVSVVTNVGLDHVISLGPDIEQIAWHKAGIARKNAPMVTGATGKAFEIIKDETIEVGAPLKKIERTGTAQAHNRAIAACAAKQMAMILGTTLTDDHIEQGLKRVSLAGRCETIANTTGPKIAIDGAHNAEKLGVAIDSFFESPLPGPKIAVVGFLGTKAKPELVKPLQGRFDQIIATEPRVYAKTSCPAEQTASLLKQIGYNPVVESNMHTAVDAAVDMATNEGNILVTGSFYLIGDIRDKYYPKKQVVLQRTSWPIQSI